MTHLSDKHQRWLVLGIPLAAMAGAMGWGIRGQYGHETGAMIAGVLVAFVLVLFYCPRLGSLGGARAVAPVDRGDRPMSWSPRRGPARRDARRSACGPGGPGRLRSR